MLQLTDLLAQVRNEIAVLKKVSSGHKNIVTLHDYFETAHNLYLVFDLCTGGELFDRICAKGNYYEADAAELVRTIMLAVQHIHAAGIVHRDLKPENLLFRTKAEDADIMIADFGLSRVMDDDRFTLLTEVCGTPGYMAPEIFKKCASPRFRSFLVRALTGLQRATTSRWTSGQWVLLLISCCVVTRRLTAITNNKGWKRSFAEITSLSQV